MRLSDEMDKITHTLIMNILALHEGETLPENKDSILYVFSFICSSDSGWEYLNYHPLKFLIDEEAGDLGEVHHRGIVNDGGSVTELMNIMVEKDFLNRLAFTKKAEFRLGLTNIVFSTEMQEKLQGFLCFFKDN